MERLEQDARSTGRDRQVLTLAVARTTFARSLENRRVTEQTIEPKQKSIDWKKDSRSFDTVAELYDTYRPSYPDDLIQTILERTGIKPGARVLEIGCGTGKATVQFAQRGVLILALDPGRNLLAVARRNLQAYPNVKFCLTTFEDWPIDAGEFQLVISAQAFHWVTKDVGFAKVAQALRPNGHLALFWNMQPKEHGGVFEAITRAYAARAPELAAEQNDYEGLIQQRQAAIHECGYFLPVETCRFPWTVRYSTQQYLGVLNTHSDHLRLSPEKRASLFDEIGQVVEAHGGFVEKSYVAVLYLAQVRP